MALWYTGTHLRRCLASLAEHGGVPSPVRAEGRRSLASPERAARQHHRPPGRRHRARCAGSSTSRPGTCSADPGAAPSLSATPSSIPTRCGAWCCAGSGSCARPRSAGGSTTWGGSSPSCGAPSPSTCPRTERGDLLEGYWQRLVGDDQAAALAAARVWSVLRGRRAAPCCPTRSSPTRSARTRWRGRWRASRPTTSATGASSPTTCSSTGSIGSATSPPSRCTVATTSSARCATWTTCGARGPSSTGRSFADAGHSFARARHHEGAGGGDAPHRRDGNPGAGGAAIAPYSQRRARTGSSRDARRAGQ